MTVITAMTCLLSLPAAQAKTLTWDPSKTGVGSNGTGTWDNTTTNWASEGSDISFAPATLTTIAANASKGENSVTVTSTNGISLGQFVCASNDRFPLGTTVTGISGTTITLSNSTVGGGFNRGNPIGFGSDQIAVFGAGAGTAGTISVTGVQFADTMTIEAPKDGGTYLFKGGSIHLGVRNGTTGTLTLGANTTFQSELNWTNIDFTKPGITLTLSGGSTPGSPIGAFNGNAYATHPDDAATCTFRVTGGDYLNTWAPGHKFNIGNQAAETGGFQLSGGSLSLGGNFQVGDTHSAFANLTGGTITETGQITIGRNTPANISKMVVDGATINQTSKVIKETAFSISRSNGIGVLDVRSGAINVMGNGVTEDGGGIMVLNADGSQSSASGTLKISGGTVTVKELRFNGGNRPGDQAPAGNSILQMTGGSLYVGGMVRSGNSGTAGGLANYGTGAATYKISLTGGIIGANTDWSSNLNMTLSTANGNTVFNAADASRAAHNITLSGVLSGNGGLTKTGNGILLLSGGNSYAGGTRVNAGTLSVSNTGKLGTGDVIVAKGAILKLDNSSAIADNANLSFAIGSIIRLDFGGTATVNTLGISGGRIAPAGKNYDTAALNKIFGGNFFTGHGSLTITSSTSIPDPSIYGASATN
ncbi:MAG TPA: autotransporter-associated beta strand repeat-containing protein [Rariglobus sp.]|jgi:autotransporter-associated beta strand protein|nr:autotransporter-associated beta strand repeat-containing protein [Rariglobus sp.]